MKLTMQLSGNSVRLRIFLGFRPRRVGAVLRCLDEELAVEGQFRAVVRDLREEVGI